MQRPLLVTAHTTHDCHLAGMLVSAAVRSVGAPVALASTRAALARLGTLAFLEKVPQKKRTGNM